MNTSRAEFFEEGSGKVPRLLRLTVAPGELKYHNETEIYGIRERPVTGSGGDMTVGTASPSVFDADLPTLDYDVTATPQQVYPQLLAAQRLAPIALGPLGPEVLSYDLVRDVLRDSRFQIPPGYILAVQGITSGPLWDKVVNSLLGMEGAEHQRVRSVVSKAFTPGRLRACTPRSRK